MINDCITQTTFNVMGMHDSSFLNLSQRFHFAVSKMVEGVPQYGGFSITAGHRALQGWRPCHETLFKSDRSLSEMTYGNWELIPKEAWEDSDRRTKLQGEKFIAYFEEHSDHGILKKRSFDNEEYTIIIQHRFGSKQIDGSDSNIFVHIYDKNFLIVAWIDSGAFWQKNFVKIYDLYVKEEYGRKGLGSWMLEELIQHISSHDIDKTDFNLIHFPPIIDVCTVERKKTVIDFLKRNNFDVSFHKEINHRGLEYSKILATHKIT